MCEDFRFCRLTAYRTVFSFLSLSLSIKLVETVISSTNAEQLCRGFLEFSLSLCIGYFPVLSARAVGNAEFGKDVCMMH